MMGSSNAPYTYQRIIDNIRRIQWDGSTTQDNLAHLHIEMKSAKWSMCDVIGKGVV